MRYVIALLATFWFHRELHAFHLRLHQQIYADWQQLQPCPIDFAMFYQRSILQATQQDWRGIFGLLALGLVWGLSSHSLLLCLIMLILLHLALLDICYTLTDIRYIGLILWLALAHLLFNQPTQALEHLFNSLSCAGFFFAFSWFTQFLFKKEMLGLGDVLLLIALSPLFTLEQMLYLLLLASLSGLVFALGYFCKFRRKIERLPFIPFISVSTFLLFIATLPHSS